MKNFLAPLVMFLAGMAILAFSTLFYPDIVQQAANTSAMIGDETASHYWGLSWALDSPRMILFVVGLLCVLFSVLFFWAKRKWGWR